MSVLKLHYISQGKTSEEHLKNIQKACNNGAECIQLRLKKLSHADILKTAKKAREITDHFQTRLIINDYYKVAKQVKADGVHLGKNDICPKIARTILESWQIIGGTANTIKDCNQLIDKQVDYIGLGPFRFTSTKNNLSPIIGLTGYLQIIKELKKDIPIIAIGGITLDDVPDILETGVYGIAISGEISRKFHIINPLNKLLQSSSSLEQVWKPNQKQ